MYSRLFSFKTNRSFFLLGPRMTGKSTLLRSRFPDSFWIDLLSGDAYQKYLGDPEKFYDEILYQIKKNKIKSVVVDEIQRLPELLNEVHRLIESNKIQFILSGSSARKLKRQSANLLGGRANEYHLFPLTYHELGDDFSLSSIMIYGSLPIIVSSSANEKKEILKSYTTTYLREEIQLEGTVRRLPSFSKFLQLAAESVSQEVNYSNLGSEIGISGKTIREYYQILEDTLIGFFLHPWHKTVRKQLAGSPKFYLFDNGITNALRENLHESISSESRGPLFEQWILQQVRAICSYQNFEGSMSYWKARGGHEVDLILSRGSTPILAVEIKHTQQPKTKDTACLDSIREEYPKLKTLLVTRQDLPRMISGHESLPYEKFLDHLKNKKYF